MATPTTRTFSPCLVCGDKSIGLNFGVRTCMACKAFFRRNAVKLGNYVFSCPKDGDCPVTHTHRRLCNCCRLAKCFRVGMQKGLILSDTEKEVRRQLMARNRLKHQATSMKTNLDSVPATYVQHQTSDYTLCLSQTDQVYLRNVFNAYQSTCFTTKAAYSTDFPTIVHTDLSAHVTE